MTIGPHVRLPIPGRLGAGTALPSFRSVGVINPEGGWFRRSCRGEPHRRMKTLLSVPMPVNAEHHRSVWLNRSTVGIALASLCSDVSHELATAVLPVVLLSLGAGPATLGLIEGSADGLSAAAKLWG